MIYQKPEITAKGKATSVIEGEKGVGAQDNPDINPVKTTAAYNADE